MSSRVTCPRRTSAACSRSGRRSRVSRSRACRSDLRAWRGRAPSRTKCSRSVRRARACSRNTRREARSVKRVVAIHRRPLDLALVAFFSVSVLYGFLFSLPEGIGVPVAPDSPWPPLRSLHEWAVAEEPAHLDPPPNLIAACLFDGFFQAPALLLVMVGLIGLRPWLVPIGLVYAGAAITNMFFYFTQTFLGPHPPPNTLYYLAFNLPWLIAPAVLGARVFFGRDLRSADV